MRKASGLLLSVAAICLCGCATVEENNSTTTTTTTATTISTSATTTTSSSASSTTATSTSTSSSSSTTLDPRIDWIFDPLVRDTAIYYSSPAIADDGTVYVGVGYFLTYGYDRIGQGLYAVNPGDGSQKWYCAMTAEAFSPVVGADGTIYVQDWDNNLFAVNPSTGAKNWTYATGAQTENIGCATPALAADGTIYMAGADRTLYAVSPEGTTKWTFQPSGGPALHTSPAVGSDGKIYVVMSDYLYSVHATGTQEWNYYMGGQSFSSPALDSAGNIYVGREHSGGISKVLAISSEGTVNWSYDVSGSRDIRSSPAIGTDGTIYIATKASPSASAEVLALNPSGTLKWSYTNPIANNDFYCSPAVDSNGLIYVADEWGYLRAYNPSDGSVAWSVHDPGNGAFNWSSPAIASDGTLYIGNSYNGLFAIDTGSSGLASSDWPKFHRDNKNTGR